MVSAIGAGGMGEVYLARDARLDRDVAIKILSAAFAADSDRVSRFQREARILASLNHPNIGGIHGIEEADGMIALVMELVDGEDLAQRIARGPMPLDEALPVARQIAEALDAAHQGGVIHRDLKPANIRVRVDGTVKVLDFGLAKAIETAGGAGDSSQSPTITTPAFTQAGMILGTAAYMSPEQARGKPVDKRTDIWSFGCVLYEMLTGRRPFPGDGISDVIASVLARDPDMSALPETVPPAIRRLIKRCLRKDRNERVRDIGDARLELSEAQAAGFEVAARPGPKAPMRATGRFAWTAAVAALMGATLAVGWAILQQSPAAPETRLEIATPPAAVPTSVAISPDGRAIVYVADSEGHSRLWLRSMETAATRVIPGTDTAEAPFWAPDSQSIGFFAGGKLRRVSIDGGPVQTVANAWSGLGGTWNRDNVILFASLGNPIYRVPAAGGVPVPLAHVTQRGSNFAPAFLPDGRHFLYFVRGNPEIRGVYVGDLDAHADRGRLLESDTGAVYASSGYLLFVREARLVAQRFDPGTLSLAGGVMTIADHIGTNRPDPGLSVSEEGTIAYRPNASSRQWQFVWFDRAGREISRIGEPAGGNVAEPSLSPDGRQIVFYRSVDGNTDVFRLEARRVIISRLTTDPADDVLPAWSPDGASIAFSSNRTGVHNLYRTPATGGTEELLLATPDPKAATDWSRNGRYLLFNSRDPKRSTDIWALPMDGSGKAFPVAHSDFDEDGGQFSPSGDWIAYVSNQSGRSEIYLQRFPDGADNQVVSTNGGGQVRWGRDGKELFYVSPDGQLTAVPVSLPSKPGPAVVGTPVTLFTPPLGHAPQRADFRHQYMVSEDSQRILVATVAEEPTAPIAVIMNWKPRRQ
ncbi:MAG: protein kinase [Vicinamibacterales bacterium]